MARGGEPGANEGKGAEGGVFRGNRPARPAPPAAHSLDQQASVHPLIGARSSGWLMVAWG
eukprot:scaffold19730_cov121-Isochrysis_galbana.AAC.3